MLYNFEKGGISVRVHLRLVNDTRYTANIDGVLAGWHDKAARLSYITLFGRFPVGGEIKESYTIHFRTDISFSICKKLEKEGMADLATDYIRGFVLSEDIISV